MITFRWLVVLCLLVSSHHLLHAEEAAEQSDETGTSETTHSEQSSTEQVTAETEKVGILQSIDQWIGSEVNGFLWSKLPWRSRFSN